MPAVLIVDAPEGDAAVLASALRVEGFDVVIAGNAAEAREAANAPRAEPIAIAVVDLMPRGVTAIHGLELARELRAANPAMRVILTGAYHLSERQLERAHCGVSGFIPKPYDVAEVVAFIQQKASGPPSSRKLWNAEPASGVSPITPPVAVKRG